MRVMGKQQVAQLQPYELAVALMIADLGAVPMQNKGIPIITGIIPILTLLISQVAMSYISLKSEKARSVICGVPSVLISGGRIIEQELIKERYSVNDLLEELRSMGYPNIADVEYAILETNGKLSVVPKSEKRPVVVKDLSLNVKDEGLPLPLVIDGNIKTKNMSKYNMDTKKLMKMLTPFGISDIKQVLLASIDKTNKLYVQKKN